MTNSKITRLLLSDDIRQIFVKKYGEGSEMVRLCRDHPDPFLFHDKKPVLGISRDEFVGIFNAGPNHYYLGVVQAMRLGVYCRLPLPNLIALILKAEFDCYLANTSVESSVMLPAPELQRTEQDHIKECISFFRPDIGSIYDLIRKNPEEPYAGITYSHVGFYVSDLLGQQRFLAGNEVIEQEYHGNEYTEAALLGKMSGPERERYFRMKEIWKTKSTGLDDMLMNLERKKRLNQSFEDKYFRFFGNLETEKSKLGLRALKLRTVLNLMQDHPDLTYRELLNRAKDKIAEAEKESLEMKNKIIRSQNYIEGLIPEGIQPVSDEFRVAYMLECRKLLKKLFFLLHSDTCPGYTGLSGQKRTEINEMWLEIMKSTKDDLFSFSPTMLLYNLPDYQHLENIYFRACDILGIDPESYETGNRLEFMIKTGASMQSVFDFLRTETERLEIHLARLELIQNEYTNEDQTQLYRKSMEDVNAHSEELKGKIAFLKSQIIYLKKDISAKLIKTA
jgi:hypothetical protein